MNRKQVSWAMIAAGLLGGWAASSRLSAQSADALIDKLVEKGILTVKEGNDLREEADKGFTSAHSVKTGMPEWVTSFRLNGDLRGRFEGFYSDNPGFVDRNRLRYRLRFGATAVIKDDLEVGFRLTSSEASGSFGGDPISGNTSFGDNGSKKFVYIDLAYGRWTPLHNEHWTGGLTLGKMENPFSFSEMVFDNDYTPEGLAGQLGYAFNDKQALKLSTAVFMLDELGGSSHDPYMGGAQLRWEATWTPKLATTLGVGAFAITDSENLNTGAVPNQNRGNTRSPGKNTLLQDYPPAVYFNPIVGEAYATYTLASFPLYEGAFPIKVGGEYMNNVATRRNGEAFNIGITLGKAGKRHTWEASYKWKQIEGDAWYEEFPDSDFGAYYQQQFGVQDGFNSASNPLGAGYGAGTNLRGHVIKLSYSPYDSFTLTTACFLTELITESPGGSGSGMTRLQVDANWKF